MNVTSVNENASKSYPTILMFVSNTDTIDFCEQLNVLNPVEGLDCGFDESGEAVIEYIVSIDAY